MKRWFPHIHAGTVSGECLDDDESGRYGRYFEICWFGIQVGISLSSLRAERRYMADVRKRYGGAA